jgi:tRNA threonylcarbamoyladenosine biosynthesis protein TsaE
MATRQITTLEELNEIVQSILVSLDQRKTAHIFGLSGELGAGKTAFVKELGKVLGVQDEITSPTFVIMKSYPIPHHQQFKILTHIDAYRIESDEEMAVLKFSDILNDASRLMCIEWPERIANLIPKDVYPVRIDITEGNTRTVTYGSLA